MNLDTLFHVDMADEAIQGLAYNNVLNYLAAIEDQPARIVMVFNGTAVQFLKDNEKPALQELAQQVLAKNVEIRACRNALQKFGVKPEELMEGITIIPAGILELVKLQRENLAYIKP
ncbi:MAG: DsrE family protein [Desulfovibrio sp.]